MLIKIAILLALFCIVWRWALGQWPWDALKLPPTRAQEMAQARRLLKLEGNASREQVLAAHKRLLAKVHPDRGGNSAAVHEANDARDRLLTDLPAAPKPKADGSVQDDEADPSP